MVLASCSATPTTSQSSPSTRDYGTGPSFCADASPNHVGFDLSEDGSYDDVWACGPVPGEDGSIPAAAAFSVPPFITDGHGFQCTELANRYLFHVTGHVVTGNPNGRYFVRDAARRFGYSVGEPGPGSVPRLGDILSEWGGQDEPSSGHVGVVTYVDVDASGNGTIHILNENGSDTYDYLPISNWQKSAGYTEFDWIDPTQFS